MRHWVLHEGRVEDVSIFGLLRRCAWDLLLLGDEALLKFGYFLLSSDFLAFDFGDHQLWRLLLRNVLWPSDEFARWHGSDTTSICRSAGYLGPTLHL